MQKDNLFSKIQREWENIVDNIFYGKDEDIFQRHIRRQKLDEKYGTGLEKHVYTLVPFIQIGKDVKRIIQNPQYTKIQKIQQCNIHIGVGLLFDVLKIGSYYGIYKYLGYVAEIKNISPD